MWAWAGAFFLIFLVAGVLGMTSFSLLTAGFLKIVFYFFLVAFLVCLVWGVVRKA